MTSASARPLSLLIATASLLTACGDGGTVPGIDYDPAETVTRVDEVLGPLQASENLMIGLESAAAAFGESSGEAAVAVLRFRPGLDRRTAGELLRRSRSLWSARLTFPAEVVGSTLVWDRVNDRYVVDEGRTGAPAGGVRIIYYAMSPATGAPVEPLVELGHIDLTDEDQPTHEAMGIRVVDTSGASDVELIDYTVGLSGGGSDVEGDLTVTAVGSLSTGAAAIEFDLLQSFAWDEAADLDQLHLSYAYDAGTTAVTFELDASSPFAAPDWHDLTLRLEVSGGARDVDLSATVAANGAVDGEILVNGVVAVEIGGTEVSPTFTRPGGAALTPQERTALAELWSRLGRLLALSQGLFSPAVVLLLPG